MQVPLTTKEANLLLTSKDFRNGAWIMLRYKGADLTQVKGEFTPQVHMSPDWTKAPILTTDEGEKPCFS